jgi:hypothetical protein
MRAFATIRVHFWLLALWNPARFWWRFSIYRIEHKPLEEQLPYTLPGYGWVIFFL